MAGHPRVRGAHLRTAKRSERESGPSPRARGSRAGHGRWVRAGRSIPACAGLTRALALVGTSPPVHPRVRGAHPHLGVGGDFATGPSPRARGSRHRTVLSGCASRSIPACAGLTSSTWPPPTPTPVHPRVRGAHPHLGVGGDFATGPSPRARGSRTSWRWWGLRHRSIPACAGLTHILALVGTSPPVHPRVRGAHPHLGVGGDFATGPSPRARGSPTSWRWWGLRHRSIPACAGLTHILALVGTSPPVHPRVRGAHPHLGVGGDFATGPSPRARGSPTSWRWWGLRHRSIPACAGLTHILALVGTSPPVHPRVRGAHPHLGVGGDFATGPSPRARGSRRPVHVRGLPRRSIPACAGLTLNDLRRCGPLSPLDNRLARICGGLADIIPQGHTETASPQNGAGRFRTV